MLDWWTKRQQASIAWALVEVKDYVKDFDWLDRDTSEELMRMAWPKYARAWRSAGDDVLFPPDQYDPSAPPPDWFWMIGQYQWDD
jgi:hypothetical protein